MLAEVKRRRDLILMNNEVQWMLFIRIMDRIFRSVNIPEKMEKFRYATVQWGKIQAIFANSVNCLADVILGCENRWMDGERRRTRRIRGTKKKRNREKTMTNLTIHVLWSRFNAKRMSVCMLLLTNQSWIQLLHVMKIEQTRIHIYIYI